MFMRTNILALVISVIVCILLLFSILLFAHPAGPSGEYPIYAEKNGILLKGQEVASGTDMLIDNGNGTVSLLLYRASWLTGKKSLYRIDNVSVIRGYGYTADGKKVITEIKLTATDPAVDGFITLMENGDGKVHISTWIYSGYYDADGYIRHPLDIKPIAESDNVSLSILYSPVYGNGSAGIVSKLVPLRADNETVYAQCYEQYTAGPTMLWERTYGNGSTGTIIRTGDGNYLLAGKKEVQVTGTAGVIELQDRAWIGKVDDGGALLWERFYNGSNIQALVESGGNYVATGNDGGSLWLLETDQSGNVLIDHSYDYSPLALAGSSIAPIGDEGYIITGNLNYPGHPQCAFVARVDDNLSMIWNIDLSRYGITYGNAVIRINDGNFVACGGEDGNIVKIDANGHVLWNVTLGDAVGLIPVSITSTSDGGIMAAYLDVTASWPQGIAVSKLASDGTTEWSRNYCGAGSAYISAMGSTGDGGYILSGYTYGFASGLYVLKIDDAGNSLWSAIYDHGAAGPIVQSDYGGYLMTTSTGLLAIRSYPQIELVKLGGIIR
jgi:hypothetical protein